MNERGLRERARRTPVDAPPPRARIGTPARGFRRRFRPFREFRETLVRYSPIERVLMRTRAAQTVPALRSLVILHPDAAARFNSCRPEFSHRKGGNGRTPLFGKSGAPAPPGESCVPAAGTGHRAALVLTGGDPGQGQARETMRELRGCRCFDMRRNEERGRTCRGSGPLYPPWRGLLKKPVFVIW